MKQKKLFFFCVFLVVIATISSLLLPIYISKIIDIISNYINGSRLEIVKQLFTIFGVVAIIEIIHMISWRIFDFSLIKLEIDNMKAIFQNSFENLHKHSYKFFTNSFGGALVKKVNKLSYSYENIIDIFLFSFLRIAIYLPTIIVIIFINNYVL
jgi:ABC-type multidrug transport system fused ATPase/permease subunit